MARCSSASSLAYGMLEESFVTHTLFNPDWAGVSVLDYGYVSALGIAPPWTLFMVACTRSGASASRSLWSRR